MSTGENKREAVTTSSGSTPATTPTTLLKKYNWKRKIQEHEELMRGYVDLINVKEFEIRELTERHEKSARLVASIKAFGVRVATSDAERFAVVQVAKKLRAMVSETESKEIKISPPAPTFVATLP